MLGERIIRIEEHRPLPRGRAQSRVASRGDSGMGDRFRTNADQWRIPIRDRCRFECRLTIEYNHRFDTEATALLPLQTVHAIMQRLQRGTVDGNDHTDGMAHRQFSSRVITEASYRNDTGDSMLSGKLPIATNAISVS